MKATTTSAVRAFADAYAGEVAPIGETIVLPDNGQMFEIIAHVLVDYGAGHVEPAGYQWAGPCAACGRRHMFTTGRTPHWLQRVCPEHAGQWRAPVAPKPARTRAPAPPAPKPLSSIQRHIVDAWDMLQLSRGEALRTTVIETAMTLLPDPVPGERDVRRQNVVRALGRLLQRDACPFVERDGALVPRENDSN